MRVERFKLLCDKCGTTITEAATETGFDTSNHVLIKTAWPNGHTQRLTYCVKCATTTLGNP